mgnify:CR=1 FL=1
MYTAQSMSVRWCSVRSPSFSCSNGIKQGGVLSPTLYWVYSDELFGRIARSRVGCYIGHEFVGALGYADDVALLAPTVIAAKQLLHVCEEFANEYSVLFNATKSVCIVTGMKANARIQLRLNGDIIPRKENATHLGTVIGPNSTFHNVKQAVCDLYKSTNVLMSNFGYCSIDVLDDLFAAYCTSFYGSPLWTLNEISLRPLLIAWKKCLKRVWKISARTRSRYVAFLRELDLMPLLCLRFINFYVRCIESPNRIVRFIAHTVHCPNLLYCSDKVSIDVNNLYNERNVVRGLFKRMTVEESTPETVALANILKELCFIRDGVLTCTVEFDVTCLQFFTH